MLTNFQIRLATACLFLGCTVVAAAPPGPAAGRQQLVDALDAAWVRALDEGEVRQIVRRHKAEDLVINIADCLPDPQVTGFPAEPVGLLRNILDSGVIRVGYTDTGTLDADSTAMYFNAMGDELIAAVLARISRHYGTKPIQRVTVSIPPPFRNTEYLNTGKADMLGLVNALGGSTEDDLRRRKARRYTCTMTSTRQIIWVLKEGGPSWQTVDDALAAEGAHFCAGPLSNELTKTYFNQKGQSSRTEFVADLGRCLPKLVNGKAAAMISPLPHEKYFPPLIDVDGDGKKETATAGRFRPIDSMIVAGTPLWVAID
ncbi:MAG: hypothetical protein FJ197_07405 [Gammaproteobacteria bacterium]|nr:hypothetical protein [Gammaproteobacteria bacterium]